MKSMLLIRKDIVLWIEDNKALVEARRSDLEQIAAEYDCRVEVRYNLRNAGEFLKENSSRIALVILDLDIPESEVTIGADQQQPNPNGLRFLKDYGWIPFIIFSAHPELAPANHESQLTPLAWLEKNAKEDNLEKFVRHILKWQSEAPDISSLAQGPVDRDRKTLVCLQFLLQHLGEDLQDWYTPWDYLPLRFADTTIQESAAQFGGRLVGWSGTSVYCVFPETNPDPDHFRSALQFVAYFWQKTRGPRSDRFVWNQWFIPIFRAGLLPNFVDPVTRVEGAGNLSSTGRSGDIAAAVAACAGWGEMAVPSALLRPDSRAEKAWNFLGWNTRELTAPIPYISRMKISIRIIPSGIAA